MDLLKIYFYTGLPIITCNMLFYSVSAISTSITSSQNVVKFISEHKKTDIALFKEEVEKQDLINKLNIIESLIRHVLKIHCKTNDEYNDIINSFKNEDKVVSTDSEQGFMLVQLTNKNKNINVLERLDEPIKLALISTSDILQKINDIILNVQLKINNHENSYLNKFRTIPLQSEIISIQKYSLILESRTQLLIQILNICNK
jgi:hypothetical protein